MKKQLIVTLAALMALGTANELFATPVCANFQNKTDGPLGMTLHTTGGHHYYSSGDQPVDAAFTLCTDESWCFDGLHFGAASGPNKNRQELSMHKNRLKAYLYDCDSIPGYITVFVDPTNNNRLAYSYSYNS